LDPDPQHWWKSFLLILDKKYFAKQFIKLIHIS
jgi:hypothetical protein